MLKVKVIEILKSKRNISTYLVHMMTTTNKLIRYLREMQYPIFAPCNLLFCHFKPQIPIVNKSRCDNI